MIDFPTKLSFLGEVGGLVATMWNYLAPGQKFRGCHKNPSKRNGHLDDKKTWQNILVIDGKHETTKIAKYFFLNKPMKTYLLCI